MCKILVVKSPLSSTTIGKLAPIDGGNGPSEKTLSQRLTVLLFDHYESILGDSAASVRDKGKRSIQEESLLFAAMLRMTGLWREVLACSCNLLAVSPPPECSLEEHDATAPSEHFKVIWNHLCLGRARIRQALRDVKSQGTGFAPGTTLGGLMIPLPGTED